MGGELGVAQPSRLQPMRRHQGLAAGDAGQERAGHRGGRADMAGQRPIDDGSDEHGRRWQGDHEIAALDATDVIDRDRRIGEKEDQVD